MLEEAEMAVLRGHQELYSRALTKASNAITDWYDSSNKRIIALSRTLDELSEKNVDPELPDISRSLELLKSRLAGQLNSNGSEENGKQGDAS